MAYPNVVSGAHCAETLVDFVNTVCIAKCPTHSWLTQKRDVRASNLTPVEIDAKHENTLTQLHEPSCCG